MSDQETARVARRLTQHERARVWERVVAERAKGDGWRDIAERAALSERQCRRIYLAYARSAPRLEPSALEREIEETVAFYDQAISDLAVISMTTRSEVARVAAIKARIATRARKLELLRVAGALDSARKVRQRARSGPLLAPRVGAWSASAGRGLRLPRPAGQAVDQ